MAEHAAYEAKTVVTEKGDTIADLRRAFESVCDVNDWKAAWEAKVPAEKVCLVFRAVEFFHADKAEVVAVAVGEGRCCLMRGRGYMGG
jgi:hypothetical protein